MLVLSRRLGEEVLIGDDIRVKILKIDGCQVSIGFSAPKDITILREEIAKRLAEKANNKSEIS